MATRRGPKVEPHKNPRTKDFEVVVDKLPEMPQAQVFEIQDEIEVTAEMEIIDEVQNEEVLLTEDEIIAEDEFITSEAAKIPHFEFQDEYHFGPGKGDAVIDALPQPQKRKKTVGELNQSELRLFHKTGFLPEI